MSRTIWKNKRGISLIEVVFAALILQLGVMGLFWALSSATRKMNTSKRKADLVVHGAALMQTVRKLKWDEATPSPSVRISPISGATDYDQLGTETGEVSTDPATFDDADDYNGYEEADSVHPRFTRKVEVKYAVVPTDGGDVTYPNEEKEFKQVKIITWERARPNLKVEQIILLMNE